MQWPAVCDQTRTNHHIPLILSCFWGVVTKSSCSTLETSHRKRCTLHKQPALILLVNVGPIVILINYDKKAHRKTIGTLHWLVFYSESVSHIDWMIGLVWMHLYIQTCRKWLLEKKHLLRTYMFICPVTRGVHSKFTRKIHKEMDSYWLSP